MNKETDLILELLKANGTNEMDLPYIEVKGDSVTIDGSLNVDDLRIIVSELEKQKPRTKTEYERVDLSEPWEHFKLMSDEGDLYVNCTDLSYEGMLGDNINLANALHDGSCIYRKVETEIDERQEFIDFTSKYIKNLNPETLKSFEWIARAMFDSGKFKLVE